LAVEEKKKELQTCRYPAPLHPNWKKLITHTNRITITMVIYLNLAAAAAIPPALFSPKWKRINLKRKKNTKKGKKEKSLPPCITVTMATKEEEQKKAEKRRRRKNYFQKRKFWWLASTIPLFFELSLLLTLSLQDLPLLRLLPLLPLSAHFPLLGSPTMSATVIVTEETNPSEILKLTTAASQVGFKLTFKTSQGISPPLYLFQGHTHAHAHASHRVNK